MVKRSGAFLHLCSFSINVIIEVDVYVRADISTIDDQWRLHMKKWFCALGMMLALLVLILVLALHSLTLSGAAEGMKLPLPRKTGKSTAAMIIR